ncbi:LysM peptidoglycan-binding domain-containing M23 family metallopeptidase [Anoxynatronum buryatiense]|uniref:Murein DD-endopeptidase MepM and murein hydrolase activator NlpD, contain LysM domain n=1 Tax=Anoxynatronum buryatiense TaxID=489973 RepID=A0AA45WWH8_9CLOT|nr:peptidoglycan DD-metalloendopeptidase family protein [Anoxynatronum buryatiense]SMP58661.1 Murein DD-endopeptidase MepM and murein hydrolase activator NlpD, contain LysM domain [Anoxynatronum buryatiense]
MSKRHRPGKKQKGDWIQDSPNQEMKAVQEHVQETEAQEVLRNTIQEAAQETLQASAQETVQKSVQEPAKNNVRQTQAQQRLEADGAARLQELRKKRKPMGKASATPIQEKAILYLVGLKELAAITLRKAKAGTLKKAADMKAQVKPAFKQLSSKMASSLQRIMPGAATLETSKTLEIPENGGATALPETLAASAESIESIDSGEHQTAAQVKEENPWVAMAVMLFRKKQVKLAVAGIAVAAIAFVAGNSYYNSYQESLVAYELTLDGKSLGIVREADEAFDEAVKTLQREMRQLYGMEAYIPDTREWLEVKATDEELTSQTALITALKNQLGIKVKATALTVDGEPLVILPSRQLAENLLGQVMEPYLDPEVEYLETGFSENIELTELAADLSDIWDMEEALQYLQTGTNEIKVHEVQPGESTWLIANRNEMTVEEIEAANPGLVSERLSIGQELNLIVPTPYLTVRTREYAELAEAIPFETEEVESDSLYQGDRRITTQGEEGFHEIKAYLVRENGREAEREILEENRISEPTTRVVAVGTLPRPATMATGTFMNPTRGRLTSPFGMRGGSRHTGIDIANSRGTAVKAADAGKVSFAGTRGAYGQLVIIDHENGYQTYYAHLNTMSVSAGTRVHKDQLIGTIGTTGRSTGPHLHFEVRKNGTPVNPLGFVNY